MEPRPRVLVAGTRQGIASVREVLEHDAELLGALSVSEVNSSTQHGAPTGADSNKGMGFSLRHLVSLVSCDR
jgi:hypothetical protein